MKHVSPTDYDGKNAVLAFEDGLALLLTWVIVGLQAAKAAMVNPARSLRNEKFYKTRFF